ncbi:MATE family efflux transporter [Anaerotignum sp.]|uniref:MATE family efflux transporter n=1 Tax=Anaerotignum sp. TaxID=2039241 RepID=UPI00332AC8DD
MAGLIILPELVSIFDASTTVRIYCQEYLFAYLFFVIANLLFINLQTFAIACGGSRLAMLSSLFGGIFNIVLDFIFIKVLGFGMLGASVATGLGMLIPCIIMGVYFCSETRFIHFVRPRFRKNVLFKTITNGMSEFSTNLVSGIVILLFNQKMLQVAGADGVAASTIIFYVFSFMGAIYMGYMFGISPLISFFYGENNKVKLQKLRKISVIFVGLTAIITTALAVLGTDVLVGVFAEEGTAPYQLALYGNKLFSLSLLFVGFNTFASSLFTALSNGVISAVISFGRTFVFLVGSILILPSIWGIDGIWLSVPVAEALSLILSVFFLVKYKKRYGY